jgi:hypothetical protein
MRAAPAVLPTTPQKIRAADRRGRSEGHNPYDVYTPATGNLGRIVGRDSQGITGQISDIIILGG